MKILNKVKIEVVNGKKTKTDVIQEGKKVVDSVAEPLIESTETDVKRAINITAKEELTAQGDKITKRRVIDGWVEAPKKRVVKKEETK